MTSWSLGSFQHCGELLTATTHEVPDCTGASKVNYYAFGSLFQVPCFLSGAIAVPALQQVARRDVKLRLGNASSIMRRYDVIELEL